MCNFTANQSFYLRIEGLLLRRAELQPASCENRRKNRTSCFNHFLRFIEGETLSMNEAFKASLYNFEEKLCIMAMN